MKKKLSAAILTIILSVSSFSFTAAAEVNSVKVQIAPFYTEIQYMSVDNLCCILNCSRIPGTINLNTGVLIPIE